MTVEPKSFDNDVIFSKDNAFKINGIYLTAREIDVVACLLGGRSTKKIASLLSISVKTAENHIRNIMSKLGYNSRDNIIVFLEKSEQISFAADMEEAA